ncbi:DMT family transporter [Eubacteriales bacterium KG127]
MNKIFISKAHGYQLPGLIAMCALFWGFSFFATRVALGNGISEIELLSLRWGIAAIIFVTLYLLGVLHINLKWKKTREAILVSMFQPCFYSIFETWGIGETSTSESSLFIATIPLMVLITGRVFFKHKFSRKTTFAITLALLGVGIAIAFAEDFSFGGKYFGYMILLVAVLLGALYCHASARASENFTSMEMTFVMSVSGGIFFNVINVAMGNGVHGIIVAAGNGKVLLSVIFLGVCCSSICYIIFNYVLSKMNTATASNVISNSTTTVGVLSGALFSGDSFGWYTVIGLSMTIVGIWIASNENKL